MNLAPVPAVKLTKEELAFIINHVATKAGIQDQVAVATAISWIESGEGFTNVYRPEEQNPLGGQDTGLFQINSLAWHYDPIALLEPFFNLKCWTEIYKLPGGWGPWNYGPNAYGPKISQANGGPRPARTDATINLASAQLAVAAMKNPYWRMKDAGMDVSDLPQPEPGTYKTYLPDAPLAYGQSSATSASHGARIHKLQEVLKEYGYFIGGTDYYYGTRTRDGVKRLQTTLKECNLWTTNIDGQYTEILYKVWDGTLKAHYMFEGR